MHLFPRVASRPLQSEIRRLVLEACPAAYKSGVDIFVVKIDEGRKSMVI